jgi:tRNA 2-thiouridine synthesizing protein A
MLTAFPTPWAIRSMKKVTDLRSMTPADIIDVLGRSCPYPIILVKKEMEKLASGEILKILCDSSTTVEEVIPHYCQKRGYKCECVRIEDKGYWEFYIQKT